MQALVKLAGFIIVAAAAVVFYLSSTIDPSMQARAKTQVAPQAVAPVAQPVRAAPPAAGGSLTLVADARGHHMAQVEIGGQRMPMLVDTGASMIALSAEDATKSGVFASPGGATIRVNTANGVVTAPRVTLAEVRLDTILVRNVEAVVMPPGALKGSLLGMSFLKRLRSFQIEDGRLILRP